MQNIGYIPHVVQHILVAYLISNSLYLTLPHSYTAPPSPLGTTSLFFISEHLLLLLFFFWSFFTSLYFLDSTCKWYNTVFVFLYLTYFTQSPSMLLQGVKCHSFVWLSSIHLSIYGSEVKNPAAKAGDMNSFPGSGRSPGGRHGNLLQYSCLENPTDRRT